MKKYMTLLFVAVAGFIYIAGCDKGDDQTATSAQPAVAASGVTNTICPVMGGPVDENIFVEYKGQKVYLCCEDCVKAFNADPERYLAKLPQFKDIADAVVSDAKDTLAGMLNVVENAKCPVMGSPVDKQYFVEYQGKKVYFCCDGCDEMFLKEPEKYLAKLPQFGGKEE